MLEEAKLEVKTMIDSGKKTLEAQKTKMVEEARKEIVSLAVEATKKMLEKQPDESLNDKAVGTLRKIG